jgi:hypothetical protein
MVDYREGFRVLHVPQIGKQSPSGWYGEYKYRYLNLDKSLPHCGVSNLQGLRNALIKGAGSYDQNILGDVKKGKDVRIYVPSIRGLFPGFYMTITGKPFSYAPPYDRIRVKQIGWDNELKKDYIIADLKYDHPDGALIYNKHVVGTTRIETSSNCDNQSMEFQVIRNQYAHGDSFAISSMYSYQGDVISGFGDERGVGVNSEIAQDIDPFRSEVESVDWEDNTVIIKPGKCNIHKLATSRPLINMNKEKWITAGTVVIVPPQDWGGMLIKNPELKPEELIASGIDLKKTPFTYSKDGTNLPSFTDYRNLPIDKFKYIYKGKTYPSIIKGCVNTLGGYIEGSKDCGWTSDIVGRFFAVAQPGEFLDPALKVSGGDYGGGKLRIPVYRWYKIKQFRKNNDQSCSIKIERIRWAATDSGAPNLYDFENYTWDGHERPLKYIIAPGAYVYDISKAWEDRAKQGGVVYNTDARKIKVTPTGDRNTKFDFAAGDPVVQAIGADPCIPSAIRIRMFNHTPGTMESAGIKVKNNGRVAVTSGITFTGAASIDRDNLKKRMDKKPPFEAAVDIATVTENGIRFQGDVTNSAISFEQPHDRTQPVKWRHSRGDTTLSVDPVTSVMKIDGSDLSVKGLEDVKGISGTGEAARNLRGIDLPVSPDATEMEIKFQAKETDNKYSLSILPNWFTMVKIKEKRLDGFVVQFSSKASKNAKIDWQLIR